MESTTTPPPLPQNNPVTLPRTVMVAVFASRLEAERAVDELEQLGIRGADLGLAIRGEELTHGGMIHDATGAKDTRGALAGAATGATVGGILGAVVALAIPGVGPVVAAGALATAMGFGAAGVVAGGLIGAFAGLGISEEEAKYYNAAFESGKAIVTVRFGEHEQETADILRRHGGYQLQETSEPPAPTA